MLPQAKANALIEKWGSIEKKPYEFYKIDINDEHPTFNCDLQLHNFLTYMKMLPAHKVKFLAAVNSFIIVSKVKCNIHLKQWLYVYQFIFYRIRKQNLIH